MAKKFESKIAKYQKGDILKHIFPETKLETIVILEERQDNKRTNEVSWWGYAYPEKGKRFALPERELFPID